MREVVRARREVFERVSVEAPDAACRRVARVGDADHVLRLAAVSVLGPEHERDASPRGRRGSCARGRGAGRRPPGARGAPRAAARSSAPSFGCVASRSSPVRTRGHTRGCRRLQRAMRESLASRPRLRKTLRRDFALSRKRPFSRTLALKSFHTMRRVLVVDDEENIRLVLRTLLKKHGYEVEVADSGEEALGLVEAFGPDVILTDVRMPKMGGLDLLGDAQGQAAPGDRHRDERVRQRRPRPRGDEGRRLRLRQQALQARRGRARAAQGRGARDAAPREPRARASRSGRRTSSSRSSPRARRCWTSSGPSPKIADYKTTVLITGESGTGKELVARAIHTRSQPQRRAVRRRQLRRHPREPARERALRAQEGRLHRRRRRPARPLRGGRRRHPLPRRDRRAAAGPAGEAPARAAGGEHPPPRRHARTSRSTCASSPRRTAISPPR